MSWFEQCLAWFKREKRCPTHFYLVGVIATVKQIQNHGVKPHLAIKVLPMPFGNDEVTRRIVLHHAKHIIRQHKKLNQ
ncbi:hypothetical protein LZ086_14975 [Acinetobacter johnsonii]|nr:hypothetical protein LZ086_14975 [Acinetobacter johnsonii]